MAAVSLSGLASSLDWQTLITNLMDAERTPETAWKAQQSANTTKTSSLSQIKSDLTALQTAAQALNDSSVFGARTATASGSWSASAAANTTTGQYTFQVQKLATQAKLTGSANVGAPISATSIVSAVTVPMMNLTIPPTPGTFSVNGQQIVVTSQDSLQDIFDKIAIATRQAVAATYDPASDTVSLKSADKIFLGSASDTSNFLSALKLYNNPDTEVTSASAIGTVNPTPGTFTVNGQQVSVSSSDSLQDILTKIGSATGQAVTATYDSVSDKVSLTSSRPITLGSASDTSDFLSVLKLSNNPDNEVTSATALGIVNTSVAVTNAHLGKSVTDVDTNGDGSFSINGVSISFNIKSESLQTIMDRVNNSAAGVTMSYDKLSDQFSLTSKATGDLNLTVSEDSGGLLEALGLNSTATLSRGTNAQVKIDGGPTITSTSNTFDQTVTGITGLSVTASSTGTQTVTVGNDTSNATSKINDFISAYNALQSFIGTQNSSSTDSAGTVTKGPLAGDRDISDFSSALRQMVFNSISSITGQIHSLDNLGIGFTGTSPILSITDSSKLNDALSNNPDDVASFFNSQPNGLVQKINTFVTRNTASTGLIATETKAIANSTKSLQSQIDTLEAHILLEQTQLTKEFTAMETALSKIQTETKTLNSYFGTSSSSSSSSSSS